ncbi:MAG: prepilin-type N-terminal cleavage/methylation domain-containing protein [Nitrospirae bacterium]|nr:prepilin-type N-terminal cleavage/methylation domain-containing protein [Nitrospirota bacterium]
MIKREAGFTLVELMITMVVFVLIIAAASGVFTGLLTQFKQQSRIAETNIEGIVGLEILRQDIEHAGYGLPWNLNGASYQEAANISETSWADSDFNDGPPDNPARDADSAGASNPPAGIRSGNGSSLYGSDVLAIKAINVSRDSTSKKWTPLKANPSFSDEYNPRQWTPGTENLNPNDNVIVLQTGGAGNQRAMVVSGESFSTSYNNIISSPWPPTGVAETHLVYGVAGSDVPSLRMPFNRADYYIRIPDAMPQGCAPNTGILYKATVRHDDGGLDELPLLDCVADIQVTFWLDTDGDGNIDWPPSDSIFDFTAQQIREQVREVRVYIVAQEGQKDINYDFSLGGSKEYLSATESLGPNSRTIDFVNLKTEIGDPEYKYYRWKLYTLVVKPNNLR